MICVSDLSLRAGSFRLDAISLELPASKYGVIMGKNGSGKTTLLECLCGLRSPNSGRIIVAGQDVTQNRPAERGIGYVPQDGALFPKMTVRGHLAFPLLIRKWPNADIEARTNELAAMLEILPLLERYPARLSGGEAQRVALGRALAFKPPLLLLDEPLSALDDETRLKMYGVLKTVQSRTGVTTLHVTHNHDEARRLADTLFLLRGSKMTAENIADAAPDLSPAEELAVK